MEQVSLFDLKDNEVKNKKNDEDKGKQNNNIITEKEKTKKQKDNTNTRENIVKEQIFQLNNFNIEDFVSIFDNELPKTGSKVQFFNNMKLVAEGKLKGVKEKINNLLFIIENKDGVIKEIPDKKGGLLRVLDTKNHKNKIKKDKEATQNIIDKIKKININDVNKLDSDLLNEFKKLQKEIYQIIDFGKKYKAFINEHGIRKSDFTKDLLNYNINYNVFNKCDVRDYEEGAVNLCKNYIKIIIKKLNQRYALALDKKDFTQKYIAPLIDREVDRYIRRPPNIKDYSKLKKNMNYKKIINSIYETFETRNLKKVGKLKVKECFLNETKYKDYKIKDKKLEIWNYMPLRTKNRKRVFKKKKNLDIFLRTINIIENNTPTLEGKYKEIYDRYTAEEYVDKNEYYVFTETQIDNSIVKLIDLYKNGKIKIIFEKRLFLEQFVKEMMKLTEEDIQKGGTK
ncbi:MAG: hypothetical protein ACOCP8_09400 [archaeon]